MKSTFDTVAGLNIKTLKKICRVFNIKNIKDSSKESSVLGSKESSVLGSKESSVLGSKESTILGSKKELVTRISKFYAVKIIQKNFRLKHSIEQICPITQNTITYPCFAYKPKGHTLFIYYNLRDLAEYLVTSGDFRDPKTREKYSDETLQSIDRELVKNKIRIDVFRSVYKASTKLDYYKEKKKSEEDILVYDRCLDDIISQMRSILEQESYRGDIYHKLSAMHFPIFKIYLIKLLQVSKENARIAIDRSILAINNTLKENSTNIDPRTNEVRDKMILFLMQTKFDELGLWS
jgi:hypothetical protein